MNALYYHNQLQHKRNGKTVNTIWWLKYNCKYISICAINLFNRNKENDLITELVHSPLRASWLCWSCRLGIDLYTSASLFPSAGGDWLLIFPMLKTYLRCEERHTVRSDVRERMLWCWHNHYKDVSMYGAQVQLNARMLLDIEPNCRIQYYVFVTAWTNVKDGSASSYCQLRSAFMLVDEPYNSTVLNTCTMTLSSTNAKTKRVLC